MYAPYACFSTSLMFLKTSKLFSNNECNTTVHLEDIKHLSMNIIN